MKKKFLLTLAAVVCALCCALGVTACASFDKTAKGSAIGNDYIYEVYMIRDGTDRKDPLFHAGSSYSKEVQKDKYTIQVKLYHRYGMGDMKMLVNGTEVALTLVPDDDSKKSEFDTYEGEYNVTKDFEITFSGAIERKTVNISVEYTADDWKDRVEESYALGVKLLVNGNAPAEPFQSFGDKYGASLESFIALIADNSITAKADDHVDIYVYSTHSDYTVNGGVLEDRTEGWSLGMTKEAFIDNLERGYHYQFDIKHLNATLKLKTGLQDIAVKAK